MAERDCYEVLGVARDASQADVKKAYRRMAMEYHPDRNPDDPEAADRFKEAARAYDVLGNEDTRQRYDRYGWGGLNGAGMHDFSSFDEILSFFNGAFGGGEASSIFDLFTGGGGQRANRGRSLRVGLEIDLREVLLGTTKTIALTRQEVCADCQGRGAPEDGVRTCGTCRGHGRVQSRQSFFGISVTCPRCGGRGTVITDPCPGCGGSGRRERDAEVVVTIPAGVENGTRMRVQGEGETIPGGPPGDLYCDVYVKEHELFERSGTNLLCDVPISYATAALGGAVEVPSLDGRTQELKVPKGTQSGDVLLLRGLGVPDMRRGHLGDLAVRVSVETPRKLTPRQDELLRELAEIEQANVSERRKSFLAKLKDYIVGDDEADE